MKTREGCFLAEINRLEYYETKLIDNKERIEDDEYRFLYMMSNKAEVYRERLEIKLISDELRKFIDSVWLFRCNVRQVLPPFVWEDEGDI